MDLSLETATADLYATPWNTFRRVTLPLLFPDLLAESAGIYDGDLDRVDEIRSV